MVYRQYAPPASLRNYVRYFWSYECTHAQVGVLRIRSFADPYPRLIFQDLRHYEPLRNQTGETYPVCYLSGLDTQTSDAWMAGTFSHFGVSFYPHALQAFFRIPAHELVNQLPELREIDTACCQQPLENAATHQARVGVLSRYLEEKLKKNTREHAVVNHIIHGHEIHTGSRLQDVLKNHAVSERQLERQFLASVGISPKKYQRLLRFEKALMLLRNASYSKLTSIAHELHYSDQSHFIKDFKSLSGLTPYDFIRQQVVGSESASFIVAEPA